MGEIARQPGGKSMSTMLTPLVPNQAELELFGKCLAPLDAVCTKLDGPVYLGYFEALSDLPGEAIFAACSELAASRIYPTWPMPGEIRAAAVKIMLPHPTVGEAWKLAIMAARDLRDEAMDYTNGIPVKEWNQRVWERLPLAVSRTLFIMGGRNMGSTTTHYAQFRDEYERQLTQLRSQLLRPKKVQALASGLAAKLCKEIGAAE